MLQNNIQYCKKKKVLMTKSRNGKSAKMWIVTTSEPKRNGTEASDAVHPHLQLPRHVHFILFIPQESMVFSYNIQICLVIFPGK